MVGRPIPEITRSDVALAVLLLVTSLGAILTGEVDEGSVVLTVPVAVVTGGAVAVRRRWPLRAALVVAIAGLAQALGGSSAPHTLMALVAALAVAWSVATGCGPATAALGLSAVLGSAVLEQWHDHRDDYLVVTVGIGGVWLLGRLARHLSRTDH